MPKRQQVGKSGVTPCKHYLLDKILGSEFGVTSRPQFDNLSAYIVIDLTAGDGVPVTRDGELIPVFNEGCSPGICLKHLDHRAKRHPDKPAVWIAIEKQPETFQQLWKNVSSHLEQLGGWHGTDQKIYEAPVPEWNSQKEGCKLILLNMNSHEFLLHKPLTQLNLDNECAVFLYNDPNHIEDWCLSEQLVRSLPRLTTSLSTLGCNVGGMKRLEIGKRRQWFDRVDMIAGTLQEWHDACLFSIGGPDQWAYLITAPTKWRDRISESCRKAAKQVVGRKADASITWLKENQGDFKDHQRKLFLTKQELASNDY